MWGLSQKLSLFKSYLHFCGEVTVTFCIFHKRSWGLERLSDSSKVMALSDSNRRPSGSQSTTASEGERNAIKRLASHECSCPGFLPGSHHSPQWCSHTGLGSIVQTSPAPSVLTVSLQFSPHGTFPPAHLFQLAGSWLSTLLARFLVSVGSGCCSGGWKSKIRSPAWSGCSEDPLLGCRCFSLCPHVVKGVRDLSGAFIVRLPIPFKRALPP